MIQLPDDWKTAINRAHEDGLTAVWASVEPDGQPSLAYYGSTQAYSDHELAIWMRTAARGLLRRIATNPRVAMIYNNPQTRLSFQLHGEARRVDDPAVARNIYDHCDEAERKRDENRQGIAVIVDLVRVIQRGEVVQSRNGEEGKAAD